MNLQAAAYMNCVILRLIEKYNLSESDARKAVMDSYLFELLNDNPTDTMHDSVNSSADDVYAEIYGYTSVK